MNTGGLGKQYADGEVIVNQGEKGKRMFVIQEGEVEVLRELEDSGNVRLAILGEGDFFGEVPFFERGGKSGGIVRATVRAMGEVRVITVDKKTILRRIHEDPSMAYRILQVMSKRMQNMEDEVARLIVDSLGNEAANAARE